METNYRPRGLMLLQSVDSRTASIAYTGSGLCGGMLLSVMISMHESGRWFLRAELSGFTCDGKPVIHESFGETSGNATVFDSFYCQKDTKGQVWLNPKTNFESVGGAL